MLIIWIAQGSICSSFELICRCDLQNTTSLNPDHVARAVTTYYIPNLDRYNITQEMKIKVMKGGQVIDTYNQICLHMGPMAGVTTHIPVSELNSQSAAILRQINSKRNSTVLDGSVPSDRCRRGYCSISTTERSKDGKPPETPVYTIVTSNISIETDTFNTVGKEVDDIDTASYLNDIEPMFPHHRILHKDYLIRGLQQEQETELAYSKNDYNRRKRHASPAHHQRHRIINRQLGMLINRLNLYESLWIQNYIIMLVYIKKTENPDFTHCVEYPSLRDMLRCYADNLETLYNSDYALDAMRYFTEGTQVKYNYRVEEQVKYKLENRLHQKRHNLRGY
ncbi:PP3 [Drosophila affinis sigmavirus]|uniref:PP3 n=1 Tax=Drosophila affinis sigmavirus TaxID=1308859 RepID=A0A140D8K1_9RHAB|nr:PP3 [Drosophila affinis sigmavirus]AMK09225.1 PP3 [Drosophila affinis sigmavirus]